jgi:uncharacterized protein with GYD domain
MAIFIALGTYTDQGFR